MESWIADLAGNPVVYVAVAACICGSAIFPPLPSDSLLVTTMGLAVAGELTLTWVVLAVLLGGWFGDVLAYGVGRVFREPVHRAARSRGRVATALAWIDERGGAWGPGLITVGRFIPGGTTAVGISSGVIGYPVRSFLGWAALGATLWTAYGAVVARLGNALFPGNLWASVGVAVVIALVISAAAHHFSPSR